MLDKNNNLIYNVSIHYSREHFYIASMVRDSFGFRTQILPLYKASRNDVEKLTKAIESAKLGSDVRSHQKNMETHFNKWGEDDEKVWNEAQKVWDVIWREDGSVSINPALPYANHKDGTQWRFVKDAKKIMQLPVYSQDIAQEIINQVKENTYGNIA